MKEEVNYTKIKDRRVTLDLPLDFYFQITKIREDCIRKGKKLGIKDVIKNALNTYFKELGYPEIK